MAKYLFLVFTTPRPGQDAAYNSWYDDQHLDDVLRAKGFVAAQRFSVAPQFGAPDILPYLAIYEIETDDPQAALDELARLADSSVIPISDSLDAMASVTYLATPLTPRVVEKS
ncbi:hypothetical protein LJR225_004296 [Phenylobacterium sp. LjRoot225]|uniref:hypothetical protein n=1 Tax=Phenylobacterium sp. LjRoot225 TaxID=3342285 RepID=UPI003ECCD4B8